MSNSSNINKNKSIIMLSLLLVIILILIIVCGVAYAKYVSKTNANVTAEIAKMICTMDVQSSSESTNQSLINQADKTIVNPYYIITVKDYSGTSESQPGEITQTDVSYTISVSPKKDQNGVDTFTLPAYVWYEISSPEAENATKIATSVPLSSSITSAGNFRNGVADTRYYKIVFLNSGEQDVTRYVDFELKAVQSNT